MLIISHKSARVLYFSSVKACIYNHLYPPITFRFAKANQRNIFLCESWLNQYPSSQKISLPAHVGNSTTPILKKSLSLTQQIQKSWPIISEHIEPIMSRFFWEIGGIVGVAHFHRKMIFPGDDFIDVNGVDTIHELYLRHLFYHYSKSFAIKISFE